jgi:hypothetical protein
MATPVLSLSALWRAVAGRLESPRMQLILGGRGRVYAPADDVPEREAEANTPWARVFILPGTSPWAVERTSDYQPVAFLVSVQVNDFQARGYDPLLVADAAHAEALALLDAWPEGAAWELAEGDPPVPVLRVAMPVWRAGPPPAAPLYSEGRRLWVSSAEYRCEVVAVE